jgi:NAD-dependent SIR2 family protein deacetylase
MPKEIIRYQCEHCHKKVYASKYRTRDHEKICFFNPEAKSCITCNNNAANEDGEAWCETLHKDIFVKGHPIVNCPYWAKANENYEEL